VKNIVFSAAAEDALADILDHSIANWGLARAQAYRDQLLGRVLSLARGEPPHARPCEVLMRGKRDAAGLRYCLEGSHIVILRENPSRIEVVDILHQSRDLERLIERLIASGR
jgi:plasmid stabilization system protein ParE